MTTAAPDLRELELTIPCTDCGAGAGHGCIQSEADLRDGVTIHNARTLPVNRAFGMGVAIGRRLALTEAAEKLRRHRTGDPWAEHDTPDASEAVEWWLMAEAGE